MKCRMLGLALLLLSMSSIAQQQAVPTQSSSDSTFRVESPQTRPQPPAQPTSQPSAQPRPAPSQPTAPAQPTAPREEPATSTAAPATTPSDAPASTAVPATVPATPAVPTTPAAPEPLDTRLLDMPLPGVVSAASPASSPATTPLSDDDIEPAQLLIVTRTMAEAQALAQALSGEGIRIKTRKPLDALGMVMSVMRLPADANVADTVTQLQARFPDAVIDANHRYQLQGNDPKTYSSRQIGWQQPAPACVEQLRIGVLDTSAESTHPALANVALTQNSFIGRETPAPRDHGTALAVLLAGSAGTEFVSLLPGAAILVAEVFREGANGPQTTAEYLLEGLDWLHSQSVDAINMSLGGPRNRALSWALESILAGDVAVVAAGGNSGANAPAVYPAADPGVVAVTAVDAAARRYRHANTGSYIDVAAPGVDLWLANSHGSGSYRSGSSYATAFVTAFMALHAKRGAIINWADHTQDLGEKGRDDEYGWGLLQWPKADLACG